MKSFHLLPMALDDSHPETPACLRLIDTPGGPEGFVYKTAEGKLKPIPCRIDPGDLVIRTSGVWVVRECAPDDKACLTTLIPGYGLKYRQGIKEAMGKVFEA